MNRFFATVVVVLLGVATAESDSPAMPYSYSKESSNGRYVFVMISPPEFDHFELHWNEAKQAEIRAVKAKWPKSGMYRNDGSRQPLWTVDWYAFSVDVASDGEHLVRHCYWHSKDDSYESEAVSFLRNGQLLKTHKVRDLVRSPDELPHSVSHYQWLKHIQFDDTAMTLDIQTINEEHFTFDVRTGEIISRTSPTPTWLIVILASAAGVLGLVVLWWFLKRMTTKR